MCRAHQYKIKNTSKVGFLIWKTKSYKELKIMSETLPQRTAVQGHSPPAFTPHIGRGSDQTADAAEPAPGRRLGGAGSLWPSGEARAVICRPPDLQGPRLTFYKFPEKLKSSPEKSKGRVIFQKSQAVDSNTKVSLFPKQTKSSILWWSTCWNPVYYVQFRSKFWNISSTGFPADLWVSLCRYPTHLGLGLIWITGF